MTFSSWVSRIELELVSCPGFSFLSKNNVEPVFYEYADNFNFMEEDRLNLAD